MPLPDPHRAQEDVAAIVILRVLRQHVRIGVADVGDAVGGQHHPIVRAVPIVAVGQFVAQPQTGFGVGGVHRVQAVDGVQDAIAILDRGRIDHGPGRIGEGHNRHPIVRAELIDQRGQAVLHHVDLVVFLHRAGHVDDEGEQGVFALPVGQMLALDADLHQIRSFASKRRRAPSRLMLNAPFVGSG